MLLDISEIKTKLRNNLKIIENYLFMTALPIFSSLIGIIIYPYIIRKLGAESYGLYVFSVSVASYFIGFISFGFYYPALKGVVENRESQESKNDIISSVFTAKCVLALISTIVFLAILLLIPIVRANKLIFIISFAQIISEVFFPSWYFQGMQKMRVVTIFQLGFRLLTIPFIFIYITSPEDIWIFALITSLSVISSGLSSIVYLKIKEQITIRLVPLKTLKAYFRDALPFFWSSTAGTIKQETVTIIIGSLFGMADVAIYDLANKIITIPRMLTVSINSALFPKIITNVDKKTIKKIIQYETFIGLLVIILIALFGHWIVLFMGGESMMEAYSLSMILSVTVLTWLVVGGYINFLFIPKGHYYFVMRNQLVALLSFFIFCIPGLFFFNSLYVLVIALSLSGLIEIYYCNYMIKKHQLL